CLHARGRADRARGACDHARARPGSLRQACEDRRRLRCGARAKRAGAQPAAGANPSAGVLMNVAISLRLATEDWAHGSAYVVEAERLGAESVWTPEAWGHDAVAPLAFLAARTSRIGLGTAIMQVGTPTPALIAMTSL